MNGSDTERETRLSPGFFADSAAAVARSLIGVRLTVNGVGGVIVETEAYDSNDPASHSFSGITARRGRASQPRREKGYLAGHDPAQIGADDQGDNDVERRLLREGTPACDPDADDSKDEQQCCPDA